MADDKFDDSLFEDVQYDESLFEDTKYEEPSMEAPIAETAPEAITTGEALMTGGLQSASFGLGDEIHGIVEAGGRAVGIKGLGKDFGQQEFQVPDIFDPSAILKGYREGRDAERENIERMKEEKGGAYTVGELAGALAAPIPGVNMAAGAKTASTLLQGGTQFLKGVTKAGSTLSAKQAAKQAMKQGVGKAATEKALAQGIEMAAAKEIGKQAVKKVADKAVRANYINLAKTGMTIGGLSGIGMSEAELTELSGKELHKFTDDVLNSTLTGGAVSVLIPGAGVGLKKLGKPFKAGFDHVRGWITKYSKDDLKLAKKYGDKIANALNYEKGQKDVVKAIQGVFDDIGTFATSARKRLSTKRTIPYQDVDKQFDDMIRVIALDSESVAVPALKKLQARTRAKYKKNFDPSTGQTSISETDYLDIVQDIGKYAYEKESIASGLLPKEVRKAYNAFSTSLKKRVNNEHFNDEMEKMHKNFNLLDNLEEGVGIKINYETATPGKLDAFVEKIKQVAQKKEDYTVQDLEKLLEELDLNRGVKLGEHGAVDFGHMARLKGKLEGDAMGSPSFIAPSLKSVIAGAGRAAVKPLAKRSLRKDIARGTSTSTSKPFKYSEPIKGIVGKQITHQAPKVAVSEGTLSKKLNDYDYLEGLLSQLKSKNSPGTQAFSEQLQEYEKSYDDQERRRIQHSLSQQPAFRKLLKEYEDLKKE